MRRTMATVAILACLLGGVSALAQQTDQGRTDFQTKDPGYESWYDQPSQGTGQTWAQPQRRSQMGQRQQDDGQRFGSQGREQTEDWYQGDRGTGRQQRFGQADRSQQWGPPGGFGRGQMGPGGTIAMCGRITQEDAQLQGVPARNKLVQLRSRRGQSLYVDLGEADKIEQLDLAGNEQIFVRGRLENVGGERVLVADEVAKVSRLTSIDRGRETQFGYVQPGQQDSAQQQDQWRQRDQQFGQQDQWRQRDQQWKSEQDQSWQRQDQWRERD